MTSEFINDSMTWLEDEDALLRAHFSHAKRDFLERKLKRSWMSINARARKLQLYRGNYRILSTEQIQWLKDNIDNYTWEELAHRLNFVKVQTLRCRCSRLQIRKTPKWLLKNTQAAIRSKNPTLST